MHIALTTTDVTCPAGIIARYATVLERHAGG